MDFFGDRFYPVTVLILGINLGAFLLMLWDKSQSRRSGAHRLSEGMLFFMATMFGSVGVLLGMVLLRHKIRKWYFLLGIPMLILENLSLILLVREQIN